MRHTQPIVFKQGLGFTSHFWHKILPFFDKLSYNLVTECSIPPSPIKKIGIGHSLGFWKLCQEASNTSFSHLIGLNAFTNFLGHDQKNFSRRSLEYRAFQLRFSQSPQKTLQHFYQQCGIQLEADKLGELNRDRIHSDLTLLAHPVSLPKDVAILILNTQDDPIVPPSITHDNFKGTQACIHYFDRGKHSLGLSYASESASLILDFIA